MTVRFFDVIWLAGGNESWGIRVWRICLTRSDQRSERPGDAGRRRHVAAVRRRPTARHPDGLSALPQLAPVVRFPDRDHRSIAVRVLGRVPASGQLPVPVGHVQRTLPRLPLEPLRSARRPLDLRPRLRLLRESHRWTHHPPSATRAFDLGRSRVAKVGCLFSTNDQHLLPDDTEWDCNFVRTRKSALATWYRVNELNSMSDLICWLRNQRE